MRTHHPASQADNLSELSFNFPACVFRTGSDAQHHAGPPDLQQQQEQQHAMLDEPKRGRKAKKVS